MQDRPEPLRRRTGSGRTTTPLAAQYLAELANGPDERFLARRWRVCPVWDVTKTKIADAGMH